MRPTSAATMDALRRWAVLLDSAFKVPGTNIRFGLDAIIGHRAGPGRSRRAGLYTVILLGTALKMRVPAVVVARMVLIAGIDMLLGLVPIAGDIGDVFWKADLRNMALLERHARPGVPPTRGDYWFVLGMHRRGRGHRSRAVPHPRLAADAFSLVLTSGSAEPPNA